MENLKHTEGEWVANSHGINRHQVWCNKTKIAACDNSVQSEIYRKKSEEEMEANARLIAAAPQLLEALLKLQYAVKHGDVKGLFEEEKQIIDIAINKAIGEQ